MSNLEIANTIKEQLGHKALFMLGAHNLIGSDKALSFKIKGARKVSHIRITYNSLDLYDMEFLKYKNYDLQTVKAYNNVYAEDLHRLIRETTGLNTNL